MGDLFLSHGVPRRLNVFFILSFPGLWSPRY
jgi:hypothetical protein